MLFYRKHCLNLRSSEEDHEIKYREHVIFQSKQALRRKEVKEVSSNRSRSPARVGSPNMNCILAPP